MQHHFFLKHPHSTALDDMPLEMLSADDINQGTSTFYSIVMPSMWTIQSGKPYQMSLNEASTNSHDDMEDDRKPM